MFNQGVARTFNQAGPTQAAQHAPHERGLARAQLPGQRHHHAADESPRERSPRDKRGGSVGKEEKALFYNSRIGMQWWCAQCLR